MLLLLVFVAVFFALRKRILAMLGIKKENRLAAAS
jgi:hypothetical protein